MLLSPFAKKSPLSSQSSTFLCNQSSKKGHIKYECCCYRGQDGQSSFTDIELSCCRFTLYLHPFVRVQVQHNPKRIRHGEIENARFLMLTSIDKRWRGEQKIVSILEVFYFTAVAIHSNSKINAHSRRKILATERE